MGKDGQIEHAKQDLAKRLNVDESQITVKSAKATQWPDASLGLKEPDMAYAMVMVDGYIIELQANGRTYTYHSDEDRRVERAS
jgi:hypothetical protein